MEIINIALSIAKMSHFKGITKEMQEELSQFIEKALQILSKNMAIFIKNDYSRGVFSNVNELILHCFSGIFCFEKLYRKYCANLWQILVENMINLHKIHSLKHFLNNQKEFFNSKIKKIEFNKKNIKVFYLQKLCEEFQVQLAIFQVIIKKEIFSLNEITNEWKFNIFLINFADFSKFLIEEKNLPEILEGITGNRKEFSLDIKNEKIKWETFQLIIEFLNCFHKFYGESNVDKIFEFLKHKENFSFENFVNFIVKIILKPSQYLNIEFKQFEDFFENFKENILFFTGNFSENLLKNAIEKEFTSIKFSNKNSFLLVEKIEFSERDFGNLLKGLEFFFKVFDSEEENHFKEFFLKICVKELENNKENLEIGGIFYEKFKILFEFSLKNLTNSVINYVIKILDFQNILFQKFESLILEFSAQNFGFFFIIFVIFCYFLLFFVIFCYFLLFFVIFCYFLLFFVIFCYFLLFFVIFCYFLLFFVIFCYFLLFFVIFCYFLLFFVIFCYFLLFFVIFCYFLLFFVIYFKNKRKNR